MAEYRYKKKGNTVFSNRVTKLPSFDWRAYSAGVAINKEIGMFARKTKENFVTLLITVVGMATALTWNEVVKGVIDLLFHERSVLYAKFYVAIVATIFTLTVTYMISRVRENGGSTQT